MKLLNLFVIIVLSCLFVGCDNIGQFRTAISELNVNWTLASDELVAFSEKVQKRQAETQQLFSVMNVPEQTELSPEGMQQAENLKGQLRAQVDSLNNLATSVSDFVGQWEQKEALLQGLNKGLEAGKLEGNVTEQISNLQESIAAVKPQLAAWERTYEAIGPIDKEAYEQFMALLAAPPVETEESVDSPDGSR